MDPVAFLLQHPIPALPLAFGLGPLEITVVCLVVLLVFGNKLPGMARNLGRSFIEFKKGVKGADDGGDKQLPPTENAQQISRESGSKEGSKP